MSQDVTDSRRIDVAKRRVASIIKPPLLACGKRPVPAKVVVEAHEIRVSSMAFDTADKVLLKPMPNFAEEALKILPIVTHANLGFTFLCFQPLFHFVPSNVMRLDESTEKPANRQ